MTISRPTTPRPSGTNLISSTPLLGKGARATRGVNPAVIALILAIAISTLAGCGGGGGGGGATTPTGPLPSTLTGTIDSSTGVPASGYSIHFSNLSTTTAANGTFSIDFDASVIKGTQTLSIFDTAGDLIDQEKVVVNVGGGAQSIGTVNTGPPAPPP